MPTERFERLHEEKKKKISDAILREVQRTAWGEIQISRIARSAKVSRASLYTYFPDKEDMYRYATLRLREIRAAAARGKTE